MLCATDCRQSGRCDNTAHPAQARLRRAPPQQHLRSVPPKDLLLPPRAAEVACAASDRQERPEKKQIEHRIKLHTSSLTLTMNKAPITSSKYPTPPFRRLLMEYKTRAANTRQMQQHATAIEPTNSTAFRWPENLDKMGKVLSSRLKKDNARIASELQKSTDRDTKIAS